MDADRLTWVGSAAGFALSMSATPGPNNTMVAASGATFGFLRTAPHMLGVAVGFPVMLAATSLGAGEALAAAPWLAPALRWVGIAYLLYLAARIARARPASTAARAGSRPLTFLQAALFQWVNPKAWVIALGAIAAYAPGGSWGVAIALSGLFFMAALASLAGWTALGVGAGRLLHDARRQRAFNLAMAGLLVASLVPLAL